MYQRKRKLGRGVAIVGAGMSKFGVLPGLNTRDLFVQAFIGEITGSLYFALIERNQRIYGIDRENDQWHLFE